MNVYIIKKDSINSWFDVLKNEVLKQYNVVINYSDIKIRKYGKPYISKYGINFNISHSVNYYCIGISKSKIGVDIEEKTIKHLKYSDIFMGKNERIMDANIMNNWCFKEAYSKYLGFGLKMDFKKIQYDKIKNKVNIINLSNDSYCCYVICNEELEKIITII